MRPKRLDTKRHHEKMRRWTMVSGRRSLFASLVSIFLLFSSLAAFCLQEVEAEESSGEATTTTTTTATSAEKENDSNSNNKDAVPMQRQPHPPSEPVVLVSKEFLEACTDGDEELVLDILSEHPEWVNGRSADGETCLHVAGIYGQSLVTKVVLEFRAPEKTSGDTSPLPPVAAVRATGVGIVADPNIRTTFAKGLRMHPLSWNVYAGHVDTARVLLEHGADPNLNFDPIASRTEDLSPITVMDVVLQLLESDPSGTDPHRDRFRQMKELLEEYNAKTNAELHEKKEPEL